MEWIILPAGYTTVDVNAAYVVGSAKDWSQAMTLAASAHNLDGDWVVIKFSDGVRQDFTVTVNVKDRVINQTG